MKRIPEAIQRTYDWLFDSGRMHRLEQATVWVAALAFVVHLAIVAGGRILGSDWNLGWFSSSYLAALYTPFSFLLFYEVLLLVRTIPSSLSSSIAKQFYIVTLIVIRRVFKDIASAEADGIVLMTAETLPVAADMVGALALFGLATVFRRGVRTWDAAERESDDVRAFVHFKQAVAIALSAVVVIMAFWSLGGWGVEMWHLAQGLPAHPKDVNSIFYEDFFGLLVLVDVLILVVSFGFTHDLHQVFRNAGYVASTVLVRLSFQGSRLESLGVLLFAVSFAVGVQAVTRFARRIEAEAAGDAADDRGDAELQLPGLSLEDGDATIDAA